MWINSSMSNVWYFTKYKVNLYTRLIRQNATAMYCLAVDNFDFMRKIQFSISAEKFVKIQNLCSVWLLIALIWREKLRKVQFSIFDENFVKIQQFCTVWLLTTLIWREKLKKIHFSIFWRKTRQNTYLHILAHMELRF